MSNGQENQPRPIQLIRAPYHLIDLDPFWREIQRGDDHPCEVEEWARWEGWDTVGWWDVAGWPQGSSSEVIIFHRGMGDAWEMVEYCDGNVTQYSYPSQELRDAATDYLAFWHWEHGGGRLLSDMESADAAPDRLGDSFAWARRDAPTAAGTQDA